MGLSVFLCACELMVSLLVHVVLLLKQCVNLSVSLFLALLTHTHACTQGLAHAGLKLSDLDEQTRKQIESDPTQVEALELAMTQRVVLIQGPPGTGVYACMHACMHVCVRAAVI